MKRIGQVLNMPRKYKISDSKSVKCFYCKCVIDGAIYHDTNHIRLCQSKNCRQRYHWDHSNPTDRIKRANNRGIGPLYIRDDQLPSCKYFHIAVTDDLLVSRYICGDYGTGKTWLGCCLICDSLALGYEAKLINYEWFKMEVRTVYARNADLTEESILRKYSECDVLVIDDLGASVDVAEAETDYARRLLYLLIDRRYCNNLTTHITCNFRMNRLADKYDGRIARRITEMCKEVTLLDVIKKK